MRSAYDLDPDLPSLGDAYDRSLFAHIQTHHLNIVPAIDQPAASFDAVFFVRGASQRWAAITMV